MDPRTLPKDARRRVHRAVLFGERLDNPRERRAVVAVARRWREQPLRMALPMLVAVVACLALAGAVLALVRPAWADEALGGGGLVGAALGVVLGCGIMVALQRQMAKRAEGLNRDRRAGGAGRRRGR